MSTAYVIALGAAVVVLLGVRVAPGLPVPAHRARLAIPDVAALVVGLVLLAAHCGAMFFADDVDAVGLHGYADVVNRFGAASMTLYSAPALLVVLALRRLQPIALAVIAAALVAVGVTMYDGGGLTPHLTAIFAVIVCLVVGVLFGTRVGSADGRDSGLAPRT